MGNAVQTNSEIRQDFASVLNWMSEGNAGTPVEKRTTFADLKAMAWRQRRYLLTMVLVALQIGILAVFLMTPKYQAASSVRIDNETIQVIKGDDVNPIISSFDTDRFLNAQIGALLFYASRIYLIVMLPFIIAQCVRTRIRFHVPDFLVMAGSAWMVISFLYNRGLSHGIESGGRDMIDVLGTWFLARGCIRSEDDLRRMLHFVLPGLLAIGALLFLESVTGKFRLVEAFPVTGTVGDSLNQYRLGLLRAWGPFSHAILAGLFMTSFITLYGMVVRDQTSRWLGMAAGASGFFTLSSAALANLALQAGFFAYRRIVRLAGYRTEWRPLALLTVVGLALLQLFSKGGAILAIIRYGALDAHTGYFRLVIWEYGTASVARRPLFGFGYTGYDKPTWIFHDSVDNHWLFLAIRYGIPCFVLYFSLALFVIYRLASISMRLPDKASGPFSALMITLSCATALGITVAFVAEFHIWYIFMLATASSMIAMFDRRMALGQQLEGIIVGRNVHQQASNSVSGDQVFGQDRG